MQLACLSGSPDLWPQRFENSVDLATGSAQFGGLIPLLQGAPSQVSVILANSNNHFERGFRRSIIGLFAQDDFRIRPNFTLNLGLREDLFTTPSEVNGYTGNLINLTDPAFTPGKPFNSPWKAFSPRLGLAWDPFGDGKTSVRMGVGMYYTPVEGRDYYNVALGGNLWLQSIRVNNPPFPNTFANGLGSVPLPAVGSIQNNLNNPTTYNYNFEIQRQLTKDLALQVAYVGSISYHMLRTVTVNTRTPTIINGLFTIPTTGPVLNPNFSTIGYEPSDGHANYNGLQSTLTQRFSSGLQFVAAFTWSKAMSDTDQAIAQTSQRTASTTMNPFNLAQDYALSGYDERVRFVLNGSYQLPLTRGVSNALAKRVLGGWAINGIYTYGSGLPIDMLDGFNNSGTGDSSIPDRPNLNPGFSLNPINGATAGCRGIPVGQKLHTPDRWFDPCAFSLSPAGTFGNLGRDTVTGPGTNEVDFGLTKSTSITERVKLDFRWEIFNLLNHPVFAIPNINIFSSNRTYSGSAGQITNTLIDNREMQFGLKLIF
jgi:hypothetical protein